MKRLIETYNDMGKIETVWKVTKNDRLEFYEDVNHRIILSRKLGSVYLENGEYYPTEYGESRFWGGIQEID